jgi:hypothetical protein
MQGQALRSLVATLAFGSAGAYAQGGDLAGVTMRVLDDLSGVDAVVLELDSSRGEGEAAAASNDGEAAAQDATRSPDAAQNDAEAADSGAERRERPNLHDVDRDERGEGRLEDRDVERPAVPPAAVP